MADIKDLFNSPPPPPAAGTVVTEVSSTNVEANVIGKAEAGEQNEVRAEAEASLPEIADADYKYEIERGAHKITITPEQGLNYNYIAHCSCAWTGRFADKDSAEEWARKHIFR